MAERLTTFELFKEFAGLANDDDRARIQAVIDAVSDAVAVYCDRSFRIATHTQYLNGSGTRNLLLPEWPIRTILDVSDQTQILAEIKYSGSGARATAGVENDKLVLHNHDGSQFVTTEISLPDVASITVLGTSVGNVTDWSLTVRDNNGSEIPQLIRPMAAQWAVDPETAELWGPEESFLSVRIADQADRMIEVVDAGSFAKGRNNILVQWKAGYTLPDQTETGDLPESLILEVNRIVQQIFQGSDKGTDMSLKSERIGDYAYSVDGEAVRAAVRASRTALSPFVKLEA